MFELSSTNIWIIVMIFFLILEIFTSDLIMFSISIGALFGAVSSYFGLDYWIQLLFGALGGTVSILFLRPLVNKILLSKKESKSNASAMIGKLVKVIEEINPEKGTGRISYFGDRFPARSIDNQIIEEGKMGIIEKVESITVYIKSKKN